MEKTGIAEQSLYGHCLHCKCNINYRTNAEQFYFPNELFFFSNFNNMDLEIAAHLSIVTEIFFSMKMEMEIGD